MQLFVMRHAPAAEPTEGQPDAWRPLTDAGAKKLKRAVKGMKRLDLRFDRVLTSPFSRATATAAALAGISDGEPIVTELLTTLPRSELLELLSPGECVCVVGHAPWLNHLIGWLVFGDMRTGERIALKKPGLAILEGDPVPGGMTLDALLTPKHLRKQ